MKSVESGYELGSDLYPIVVSPVTVTVYSGPVPYNRSERLNPNSNPKIFQECITFGCGFGFSLSERLYGTGPGVYFLIRKSRLRTNIKFTNTVFSMCACDL